MSRKPKPMTPENFRYALAALGLTQAQAAEWLGIGLRTCSAYATGEATTPLALALLLRLMVAREIRPEDVT